MSEYQSYRFDAIGRPLSPSQRKAVSQLSSHISVGPSSAVVEYYYGDFKHNPLKVLEKHFDLFTYESNWGTQRLAFRFDKAAIKIDSLTPYKLDEYIEFFETDDQLIIDCHLEENWDGHPLHDYYDAHDYPNSPFGDFYQEIQAGDFRSLYLFWLKAAEAYDELENEPPIPAGLAQISDAHRQLANFIALDKDLLETACSLSKPERATSANPTSRSKNPPQALR